jgi:uncharacterized protein DUF2510
MDIYAKYISGGGSKGCVLRIEDAGISVWYGKKMGGGYRWDEIRRVSFDDPGRTKASVGALVMFGALGLASRRAFTLITVSLHNVDIYFEADEPVAAWRAAVDRLVEEVQPASDRTYVDGALAGLAQARLANYAPGWYPDPLGQPRPRWHDGAAWTDHTSPAGIASGVAVSRPGSIQLRAAVGPVDGTARFKRGHPGNYAMSSMAQRGPLAPASFASQVTRVQLSCSARAT